ncbi:glycosyltransferase family 2 protein [Paraburkholderia sp. RL17-337-BIB-A]|uniref:glycosyltransferase family 2 protein n=1 Tax=Paraburkholderia sp. RL17-337-BIB-A TaxID=3031636 RepID=UPI0038BD4B18
MKMDANSRDRSVAQRISVVVLTHNRAKEVMCTLSRLVALPEQPEIIVADNASSDRTVALIEAGTPGVRVVQCLSNLGAAGRNRAVARVTTDYVAFCDDDMWWEPGSLARAVRVFDATPRAAVLSARVLVGKSLELDETCVRMRNSPLESHDLPGPSLTGYLAGACVFRTDVFRAVGGYQPRLFIGGEEELVALDVLTSGGAIVYVDSMVVHHHPSRTQDSRLRRRLLARNAAWISWLRLPLRDACCATGRAFAVLWHEGAFVRDVLAMMRALPWALARRRVVPPSVLAMRRQVHVAEQGRKEVDRRATS